MKTMFVFIAVTLHVGPAPDTSNCLLKDASDRPSDSRYVNEMFCFLRFIIDESTVNQRCRDAIGDANKRSVDSWLVYIWGMTLGDGNLQGLPPNYIYIYKHIN